MSITHGYCTLAQLKDWLSAGKVYAASTLAFDSATGAISDSALGLKGFPSGNLITIAGSGSNDGTYSIKTGGAAGSLVVNETLVDEAAGAAITITDVTDPLDDAKLEAVITAVSRQIDKRCGREFYQTGTHSSPETRYYSRIDWWRTYTDDLVEVVELATDDGADRTFSTVWTTADYELAPRNAASRGRPFTWLQTTPLGSNRFPYWQDSVRVKGVFGWGSIPPEVQQACLMQATRIYKRKDAVFGVMGSSALGEITLMVKLDPDVEEMLTGVKRLS